MVKRFGPAIGGQVTGATVKGNKVTQLVNSRYTTGGGEKFLTPSAKFAVDEQKALQEAQRREKTIERLVREKELAELERELSQLEEQYSEQEEGYLKRSLNQLVKGNYTEDVTLLGTGGQVATGLLGVDLPGDIRDIVADLDKWEWTWGHTGQTGLDVVGLLPIVGALKYTDEAAALIKGTKKATKAAEAAEETAKTTIHGAKQMIIRGFSEADVVFTKTGAKVMTQADGAKIFIKEISSGKYNIIVEGERGIITGLKNIDAKALENLAKNYGWK